MRDKMGKKKAGAAARAILVVAAAAMLGMAGCQDEEALKKQETYRQLGIKELNEGKYEDAVKDFQKALDQSKAKVGDVEIDICYYKATAQYSGGDAEGAIETCTALVDYDKKDAKAYFLRGSFYLKEGEGEKGLEDYGKAFQYGKEELEMYVPAYESLMAAGFEHEAQSLLEDATEVKGDEPEQCRERGRIYLLQGYYGNARQELDKAINAGDDKALLYMAQVYEAQGEPKNAAPLYENYIEKNSKDVTALNQLGEMQLEEGKYEQALKFFQTALEADPAGSQRLRKNEIIAYEKMLDFAAAKEKLETYLQDFPEDEEAQREYVFLQTR